MSLNNVSISGIRVWISVSGIRVWISVSDVFLLLVELLEIEQIFMFRIFDIFEEMVEIKLCLSLRAAYGMSVKKSCKRYGVWD